MKTLGKLLRIFKLMLTKSQVFIVDPHATIFFSARGRDCECTLGHSNRHLAVLKLE